MKEDMSMVKLMKWVATETECQEIFVCECENSSRAAEMVPVILRTGTYTEEEKASYGYSWGFYIE